MCVRIPVAAFAVAAFAVVWGCMVRAETEEATDEGAAEVIATIVSEETVERKISLKVECPATLHCGAENIVTFTLRNDCGKSVAYYEVPPRGVGVGFKVSRNGEPVDLTKHGRNNLLPSLNARDLAPVVVASGQKVRITVNLSRYHDLSLPGTYDITAHWSGEIQGGEAVQIQTRALTVDVVPKSGSETRTKE